MAKRIISIVTIAVMLFSALYLPVYAQTNTQKIKDIANNAYQKNMGALSLVDQQLMKNVIWNVEHKMSGDPVGYLSMSYMAMVTKGADPKAQAIMAAWSVSKHPESLCLVNNLGYALYVLKDYDNAIETFKQALKIDSKSLETIVNLGNVYFDTGKDEDAKAAYESAIKIDAECFKAWEGLFGYYMKKKNYEKAMEIVAKIKPMSIIAHGREEMQAELDARSNTEKLDNINEGDSLNVMEQKLDRISKTKPLNVAPIVEEIDPAMAQKIKDAMENLKVTVQVPYDPWVVDFSSAEQHYITSNAYNNAVLVSEESMKPDIDPAILEKAKQIEGLSEGQIKGMVDDYLKDVGAIVNQIQGTNMNDYTELMGVIKGVQGLQDPFAALSPAAGAQQPSGQQASGQSSTTSTAEQLGAAEKKGVVSTSNYNNYLAHKMNIQKYMQKINREFSKGRDNIKQKFEKDMNDLRLKQEHCPNEKGSGCRNCVEARNNLRDKYVQEFGSFLMLFYRSHVRPAIEKIENTEALYIKNMANKKLKNMEAERMKTEINAFLQVFAKAEAPVDSFEARDEEAAEQLQKKIQEMKETVELTGGTPTELKLYEQQQKSLLEKIYEDTKFETTVGVVKVTYENAELTLGLNDPLHNKYMDLGVNLKDFSASLTEGEGCEVGFKVATGAKGTAIEGVEAEIGWSGRQPGQKTTIYFDDNFNAVDAQVSRVSGSQGFSAGVEAADFGVEGGLKVESTAEGTNSFVSSIKTSYKDLAIWEKQYKEELK